MSSKRATSLNDADNPSASALAGWQSWLIEQLRPRARESDVAAEKRLANAISSILDKDPFGSACAEVERLLINSEDVDPEIALQAFRTACSRATAKMGRRRVHASLLMAPVLIRGPNKQKFPRQIDPITCVTVQHDAHARLERELGKGGGVLVPVSAVISLSELTMMPASMLHRLLRSALDSVGAKMGSDQFLDIMNEGVVRKTKLDANSCALHWREIPSAEDTHAFVEQHPTSLITSAKSLSEARWVAPRFVVFVCIGWRSDYAQSAAETLRASQGWASWLGRVLEGYRLDPEHLEMIHRIGHPLSTFMPPTSGISHEERETQSISALGLFSPPQAIECALRAFGLAHAMQELRNKAHAIDPGKAEAGSLVYDPQTQLISMRFDAESEAPDLQIRSMHAARLYPFILELASHMEDLGCPSVAISVLDDVPLPAGGERGFAMIH